MIKEYDINPIGIGSDVDIKGYIHNSFNSDLGSKHL